jgi:hypothetical protein
MRGGVAGLRHNPESHVDDDLKLGASRGRETSRRSGSFLKTRAYLTAPWPGHIRGNNQSRTIDSHSRRHVGATTMATRDSRLMRLPSVMQGDRAGQRRSAPAGSNMSAFADGRQRRKRSRIRTLGG